MEKKEIAELFMKGIDCSQVVVGAFAEELGITTEEAYKMEAVWVLVRLVVLLSEQ